MAERKYVYSCIECGSEDVCIKYWVNPNTQIITGETSDSEREDSYCNECDRFEYVISTRKDADECERNTERELA